MLANLYAYDIENYFNRWFAALRKYTAKQANGAERLEDFLRDARRFGAEHLKEALDHVEPWSILYYHEKTSREKLYETWTGIRKYI